MNAKEYMAQAIKNLKDHRGPQLAIADWALGLGGELGEVAEVLLKLEERRASGEIIQNADRIELAKEMGDVVWYVFALSKQLDLDLEESVQFNYSKIIQGSACTQLALVHVYVGRVLEAMKHYIAHKEKLNREDVKDSLKLILATLHGTANYYHMNLAIIAELNVAKLSHRYKEGAFSTEASTNRHEAEKDFEDTEIYKEIVKKLVS